MPNAMVGYLANLYYLPTAYAPRASWGGSQDAASGYLSSTAPSHLTVIGGLEDIKLAGSPKMVDAPIRDLMPFNSSLRTIVDASIEFKMYKNITLAVADPGQEALSLANINQTTIAIVGLDQLIATSGAAGIWADWEISKWDESDPISGIITLDVALKPSIRTAVKPQWVRIT